MITRVGWTDGGKHVCIHVQTMRTHFSVDMTPDEGEELANDLLWVVNVARNERASKEGSE